MRGRVSYETQGCSTYTAKSGVATIKHRRTTVTSIFQSGSNFSNTKCYNLVSFHKSSHIYVNQHCNWVTITDPDDQLTRIVMQDMTQMRPSLIKWAETTKPSKYSNCTVNTLMQ